MVEMRRIELLSENTSASTSPGAYGYLHSLICAGAVTLTESVASLCMVRAKLNILTFTTNRRQKPGRGAPGADAR